MDAGERSVTTADGVTFTGDVLVLAAGARANFFDVQGAAEHSFPLYSVNDANALRSWVLGAIDAVDADHRPHRSGWAHLRDRGWRGHRSGDRRRSR